MPIASSRGRVSPRRAAHRPGFHPAGLAVALLSCSCQNHAAEANANVNGAATSPSASVAPPTTTRGAEPCLEVPPAPALVEAGLGRLLDRARASALARASDPDAWVRLGRAWQRVARETADGGFMLNADACVREALARAPEHAGALGLRQAVLLHAHDFAGARELAARVLRTSPEDLSAWLTESDGALELGDLAGAERATQRALDLEPGLASYARAAYLSWLHGDVARAIELMRLAIDAAGSPEDPESRAWALAQAALLFWHRGDYAGAAAGFELALEVQPRHAPALVGLGQVAVAGGDLARARDLYARALELRPDVDTAARLGDVLIRLDQPAQAEDSYRRAEALGAHDRRALSLYYSSRDREPTTALALAQAEFEARPDPYTEDVLAWALYRNRRFPAALSHIEHARRFEAPDARLLFHHGAIALAAGRVARGRALLRAALASNPHFDLHGERELRQLLGEPPS
ncbi:MAG TPA: tetratricopeptide repeat protein [Polyangiaceae bacterium]|nr:tetratricopeptide repeat protein [Polyangiaceae bacterium]